MAEPPSKGSVGASTSPPLGRRDQLIASEKNVGSPNSSFNGSVNLSASNSSGIERSGSTSKRSKEDAKRDKEEEKTRKKDLKKEKERAKISVSLGLPEGEKILHEFSCAIKKAVLLTGRLYVTPTHLLFKYSLGSSQESISYKDIVEIRKELTYFIPNAILIRADKEYFFGSFLHRDQAWAIFNILIANAKLDKPMDVETLHKATKQAKHQAASQIEPVVPDGGPAQIDLGPEDEFTLKMWGSTPDANSPLPADCTAFKESSAKTATVDAVLPVGLKTAWRLFLADPSTFSMEIHTFVKDFDIKVGNWAVDASKAFYTRTLTFQTPIQSRLVRRNSCDVKMVQKLLLKSAHEMSLDTSNFITGTPYAEDFTVEAKWRFTSDEADKTTHLVVFLEMNWSKTPMAITKNMIDKASLGGAGAMVESWVRLAKQKIQKMSGTKEAEVESVPVAGTTAGTPSKLLLSSRAIKIFVIVWLVVLFLMVLYMNAKISALTARIKDLERIAHGRVPVPSPPPLQPPPLQPPLPPQPQL